jgi:cytochrome b
VAVWSAWVRLGHWALAACVIACLLLHEGGSWHERLGYTALALALWRVGMGWFARARHLRFSAFVQGPAATWAYARAVLARSEARHLGHNPLGGWMIVALLLCALVAAGSGALYNTDRFWGDPLISSIHGAASWSFVVLVPLHVGGVVLTSLLQRENLLRAMFTGRKRAAQRNDITL